MNHKVYPHPPKTTTGRALASYSLGLEQWQGHCRLFCACLVDLFSCLSSMSCGYGPKISLVDMRSDGVMQNIGSRNRNVSFNRGLFTTLLHYHLQILCWYVLTAQRDSHESWHLWQFSRTEISHWDHEDTSNKYNKPHPNQWWEFGPPSCLSSVMSQVPAVMPRFGMQPEVKHVVMLKPVERQCSSFLSCVS